MTPAQRRGVALLNCGDRALLTAFTAAGLHGLRGWERPTTHVLLPAGTRVRDVVSPVRLHYIGDWTRVVPLSGRRLHSCAPSLVLAASTCADPRPACGILGASVQQRLVAADQLRAALEQGASDAASTVPRCRARRHRTGRARHERVDLGRLCHRAGLPAPIRQAVRVEPGGRRRYLDAEWTRPDGRRVVVEVGGAPHLSPRYWWDDQFRQNELVIADDIVLRFPSVVVRTNPEQVIGQLRRVLP